ARTQLSRGCPGDATPRAQRAAERERAGEWGPIGLCPMGRGDRRPLVSITLRVELQPVVHRQRRMGRLPAGARHIVADELDDYRAGERQGRHLEEGALPLDADLAHE